GSGVSRETVPLRRAWPNDGPPLLWELELGEGHAGAAVNDGRVYILDYDREAQADALRCLSFETGKEIWRFSYPVRTKRNHGMSRTVPAIADGLVVSLGPKCHVVCLDANSGEFQWGIDLVKDYGTEIPPWYAGQCPLIEDGRVILAPGGKALIMAVDSATGEVLWETPNPRRWQMTHCSIVPMTFAGKRMFVYSGSGGVAAVSAEDGSPLWETDAWKISIAAIATPVVVGDGLIFFSGGYNSGSMLVQLSEKNGQIATKPVFRLKPEVFGATQQTPVFYEGHIYCVRPNGEFVCLDLQGKIKWASGPERRFGLGPFLIANDLAFVMNDHGHMTLFEATPAACRQLAEAQVLNGHDAWGPFALAGGRLLARDLTRMVCLDVRNP
ncbi:MAG: PQQ-like beta-propeller repeat protein, partial [Planctomycetota bacterium]|nr:PQQ-like beta-propeller repeat protein [Planctomycetota bacterium]